MADFCFIHGAWHGGWCWSDISSRLVKLGHSAFTVNLPCDDKDAGLNDYAEVAVDAFRGAKGSIVVAHSFGGLIAPLMPSRLSVKKLIFLAAVLPAFGKSYAQQLSEEAIRHPRYYPRLQTDDDGLLRVDLTESIEFLFHDLTAEKALWCFRRLRPQSSRPSTEVTPLLEWPKSPAAFIACTSDRALNPAWALSVPSERYGIPTFVLSGGHSPWASRPEEVTELLLALCDGCFG